MVLDSPGSNALRVGAGVGAGVGNEEMHGEKH
jgi:hypothetical protein